MTIKITDTFDGTFTLHNQRPTTPVERGIWDMIEETGHRTMRCGEFQGKRLEFEVDVEELEPQIQEDLAVEIESFVRRLFRSGSEDSIEAIEKSVVEFANRVGIDTKAVRKHADKVLCSLEDETCTHENIFGVRFTAR